MAIKINLMPEEQKRGWQQQMSPSNSQFFSAAGMLFAFSLFIFAGIFIYKSYVLEKKLADLKKENSALNETISGSFDLNLFSLSKKIKSSDLLLENHLYWSKYFEILESFTLKNIYYDQFSVNSELAKNSAIQATIVGHADNFSVLSKQIAVFMSRKEFSNIKFDGGEMDKDGIVKFKIVMDVGQDLVKEKK